ncbi:sulfotransferase 1B1-like [Saccostrea echinata]|uniref:sulfotransferase 1B1-like n=1 Tax=Saccostrea echinata TaxID=191078 RepID=UPI002A82DFA7|nr:sulfotransferase 1B1-like [Saccostrea echinata]
MNQKEIKDSSGKVILRAVEYDGILFPAEIAGNLEEKFRQLNNMTFRDSDVCVVSFPKSGTHWCYEIVAMLRNNTSEFQIVVPPLLDLFPVEKLKQVPDGVYVSHFIPRHMPKDFLERRCKIIHIYRNPKDVVVSMFHFLKKTKMGEMLKDMEFDVFFEMFITGNVPSSGGSWMNFIKEWMDFTNKNTSYPFMNICYEDMKRDLKGHVRKISNFLELESSEELIDEIATKCEFKTMSEFKNSHVPEFMSNLTNIKDKHIMYRKGEAGDWKNWLKVAQSEAVDSEVEVANIPLDIKYT